MKTIHTATLLSIFTALTVAAPTPPAHPNPGGPEFEDTIFPSATSQYKVWTGAITFGTDQGLVQKTQISSDITTLVTFDLPSYITGNWCSIQFQPDPSGTISGTGEMDIFFSNANPTTSTEGWPPGNQRGDYFGRMEANNGFVDGYPTFDCPGGQTVTMEFVPTGDLDQVSWDVVTAGPMITYGEE